MRLYDQCLPSGPLIHLTVIHQPVWRTATPHLEPRLVGFILCCISNLETYHCLINGLLPWWIVASSPSMMKTVDHGTDLVEAVISWLVTGHCLGVVIYMEAAEQNLEAVNCMAFLLICLVIQPVVCEAWQHVNPHDDNDAEEQIHLSQTHVVPLYFAPGGF